MCMGVHLARPSISKHDDLIMVRHMLCSRPVTEAGRVVDVGNIRTAGDARRSTRLGSWSPGTHKGVNEVCSHSQPLRAFSVLFSYISLLARESFIKVLFR